VVNHQIEILLITGGEEIQIKIIFIIFLSNLLNVF